MTEFIRFKPTPTDAELEAERDAKYQRELAEWFRDNAWCVNP
jgi:hypothetical protein